ncbi:hypothetical protein ACH5RR_040235 [Cinchona calisaya]|uniref:F-box protein At3g26010-like beta-propeller domain-containing protein n=1 Tax=Cinchona calisaya TaxID=153742 RepID=A0ABD2XS20_9GENT
MKPMTGFLYQNIHLSTFRPEHNGFLFPSTDKKSDETRLVLDGGSSTSLEESVGFLDGKNVYIVASSKGFFLCCQQMQNPMECYRWMMIQSSLSTDPIQFYMRKQDPIKFGQEKGYPMEYYVYNPSAEQWLTLPKPRYHNKQMAVGFSCTNNNMVDDTDLFCYAIVRYEIPSNFWMTEKRSIVTIESFSSESSEWTTKDIKLDAPHLLYPVDHPAVVVDGIFFWLDIKHQIIAIDVVGRCGWQLNLPHSDGTRCGWLLNLPHDTNLFNSYNLYALDGSLHYVSDDGGLIRIWTLDRSNFRCPNAKWLIKYQGRFCDEFPEIFGPPAPAADSLRVKHLGFHPDNPQNYYCYYNGKIIAFDMHNKTMQVLDTFSQFPSFNRWSKYFLYEWNEWPRLLPLLKKSSLMTRFRR